MKISVQARLDGESAAALEVLERRLGMNSSEIVRASLLLMVKQHSVTPRKKFLGVGEFASGIGDLATNKKHMEGFGLTRSQRAELKSAKTNR